MAYSCIQTVLAVVKINMPVVFTRSMLSKKKTTGKKPPIIRPIMHNTGTQQKRKRHFFPQRLLVITAEKRGARHCMWSSHLRDPRSIYFKQLPFDNQRTPCPCDTARANPHGMSMEQHSRSFLSSPVLSLPPPEQKVTQLPWFTIACWFLWHLLRHHHTAVSSSFSVFYQHASFPTIVPIQG